MQEGHCKSEGSARVWDVSQDRTDWNSREFLLSLNHCWVPLAGFRYGERQSIGRMLTSHDCGLRVRKVLHDMEFDDLRRRVFIFLKLEGYQRELFREKRVQTALFVVSYPSPLPPSCVPLQEFSCCLDKSNWDCLRCLRRTLLTISHMSPHNIPTPESLFRCRRLMHHPSPCGHWLHLRVLYHIFRALFKDGQVYVYLRTVQGTHLVSSASWVKTWCATWENSRQIAISSVAWFW